MLHEKNGENHSGPSIRREVTDLGKAAYLAMHGHKLVGRRGRSYFFKVYEGQEVNEFEERCIEYLTSTYHDFDAKIMSLKKMDEYISEG